MVRKKITDAVEGPVEAEARPGLAPPEAAALEPLVKETLAATECLLKKPSLAEAEAFRKRVLQVAQAATGATALTALLCLAQVLGTTVSLLAAVAEERE